MKGGKGGQSSLLGPYASPGFQGEKEGGWEGSKARREWLVFSRLGRDWG